MFSSSMVQIQLYPYKIHPVKHSRNRISVRARIVREGGFYSKYREATQTGWEKSSDRNRNATQTEI